MKKIFQIVGISFLTCFSFYYTNKVIDLSKKNDPLMKEIIEYSSNLNVESVASVIEDNYIKQGSSGYEVDIDSSYRNMKKLGYFTESLIVYKSLMPDNSIKDNYDKYVTSKITNKYEISLIIKINDSNNLDELLNILKNNNINTTFFIDGNISNDGIRKITNYGHELGILSYKNNYDLNNIKYMQNIINNYNKNNIYCLTEAENNDLIKACSKLKMNTLLLDSIDKDLYHYIKNNLEKGNIYLVSNTSDNVNKLDIIIKYIKQKGYSIKNIDSFLN